MIATSFFLSPLEQFQILPFFSFQIGLLDFTITNETVILILILFFSCVFLLSLNKENDSTLFIIPNR